jgi:hypothetical protein
MLFAIEDNNISSIIIAYTKLPTLTFMGKLDIRDDEAANMNYAKPV